MNNIRQITNHDLSRATGIEVVSKTILVGDCPYLKFDPESGKIVPVEDHPELEGKIVYGYYNSMNSKFYSDANFTTEITGKPYEFYVDLDTKFGRKNTVYIFEEQNYKTDFVTIGKTIVDCPYYVITQNMLGPGDIFKFGYCVNNNIGLGYPIFLGINGNEYKEFRIGKTGMLECQPEEWLDENDPEDTEVKTMKVSLTEVLVPKQSWNDNDVIYNSLGDPINPPITIPFTIDYCYLV